MYIGSTVYSRVSVRDIIGKLLVSRMIEIEPIEPQEILKLRPPTIVLVRYGFIRFTIQVYTHHKRNPLM